VALGVSWTWASNEPNLVVVAYQAPHQVLQVFGALSWTSRWTWGSKWGELGGDALPGTPTKYLGHSAGLVVGPGEASGVNLVEVPYWAPPPSTRSFWGIQLG